MPIVSGKSATLYGVSARLDNRPELFFTLRGIKVETFVGAMVKQESTKILSRAKTKSARIIAAPKEELSDLFGIDIDDSCPRSEKPAPVKDDATIQKRKRGRPPKKLPAVLAEKAVPAKKRPVKKIVKLKKWKTS